MNIENPEIRAQVLDWQRRHNIRDDDPAMALLELLNVYYHQQPGQGTSAPEVSSEEISHAVAQAVRSTVTPSLERLASQMQVETQSASTSEEISHTVAQAVRSAVAPTLERLTAQIQSNAHSAVSPEVISQTVKASVLPSIERLSSTIQEIEKKKPADVSVSAETISEAIRTAILPSINDMSFQTKELKNKLESMNFSQFSEQIGTYHDGIDYCTKKLDVVKKESESLLVSINKASSSIKPVTKGAVVFLMGLSAVIGYVLRTILG